MYINDFVTDIEKQQGKFLLMRYGQGALLGFEGDGVFQRLSYNFAYNYSVIYYRLSTFGPLVDLHRLTPTLSYVYTSEERVKKGLVLYFRNQFLMHRTEIDELKFLPVITKRKFEYSKDLEKAVFTYATLRAESFLEKRIDRTNFLRKFERPIFEMYKVIVGENTCMSYS